MGGYRRDKVCSTCLGSPARRDEDDAMWVCKPCEDGKSASRDEVWRRARVLSELSNAPGQMNKHDYPKLLGLE